MNLYFGNAVTIVSTLMVLSAIAFIVYTAVIHQKYEHWGRRVLVLALYGLVICCFVATRDNYHLSVQSSFDDTVTAGLFTIDSIQSTLCCIGGGIIALASISSIFIKNQKYRKTMFFVIGTMIILKTILIEISRLGVL